MTPDSAPVIWFEDVGQGDVPRVGGKNASLSEMVGNLAARGVKVPLGLAWLGFATTAEVYWRFVDANGLREIIASMLSELGSGKVTLAEAGKEIRRAFLRGEVSTTCEISLPTTSCCDCPTLS